MQHGNTYQVLIIHKIYTVVRNSAYIVHTTLRGRLGAPVGSNKELRWSLPAGALGVDRQHNH